MQMAVVLLLLCGARGSAEAVSNSTGNSTHNSATNPESEELTPTETRTLVCSVLCYLHQKHGKEEPAVGNLSQAQLIKLRAMRLALCNSTIPEPLLEEAYTGLMA
jgi:hypothetical protein